MTMADTPTAVEEASAMSRELGANISALRRFHRLSQFDLAEASGISMRTLSRMESGDLAVSATVLLTVMSNLGVLRPAVAATRPAQTRTGADAMRGVLPPRMRELQDRGLRR